MVNSKETVTFRGGVITSILHGISPKTNAIYILAAKMLPQQPFIPTFSEQNFFPPVWALQCESILISLIKYNSCETEYLHKKRYFGKNAEVARVI